MYCVTGALFSPYSQETLTPKEFSRDDVEANILLTTIVTKANSYIDETSVARFTHGAALASRETFLDGNNLWGGDQSAYKINLM